MKNLISCVIATEISMGQILVTPSVTNSMSVFPMNNILIDIVLSALCQKQSFGGGDIHAIHYRPSICLDRGFFSYRL